MRIKQSTIGAFAFAAYAAMSAILAVSVLFIQSTLTTERRAVAQQAEFKELARDLDESSDLLTQSCRRYIVTGEARHLRDYWAEVEVTRRREHVLERLEANGAPKDEFTLLERAKRQSDAIIPTESHAMRLVHEVKGISLSEMPSLVAASTLSPSEMALSPEGKMAEARRLLFMVDTEDAHNEVKSLIDRFERRVEARTATEASAARSRTGQAFAFLTTLPFLIPIGMGVILAIFQWLIGAPIARYIRTLQRDDAGGAPSLAAQGTDELRRLAEELNRQFETNERQRRELAEANDALNHLAAIDGLTGVKNRRAFGEALDHEIAATRRSARPLSLILLDVDHFKAFNDEFGHPEGDGVLRAVAATITASARANDTVARYGGEEFVVVLPDTDAETAEHVAERIRQAVEGRGWPLRPITVSLGVATTEGGPFDGAWLTERADRALYVSKAKGRNRATRFRDLAEAA